MVLLPHDLSRRWKLLSEGLQRLTPASGFCPAWMAESSPEMLLHPSHLLCSLLFILSSQGGAGGRQEADSAGVCRERNKVAGPGDGAVVAPAIPGPGGKQQWLRQCSPAWIPIPLHAKVWPRRACHHALEQWLMGQEVCREQGSFSFCFPLSPQLLANASPASGLPGSSCPHLWEPAGRTMSSLGAGR